MNKSQIKDLYLRTIKQVTPAFHKTRIFLEKTTSWSFTDLWIPGKRSHVAITWLVQCTEVSFLSTVFKWWQLHMHSVQRYWVPTTHLLRGLAGDQTT